MTDAAPDLYMERAHLVALLAAHYPSVISYNDPAEPDWPVVYIWTEQGQLSWHIAPGDVPLFRHVCEQPAAKVQWDGHTTEQKYVRIRALLEAKDPAPRVLMTKLQPRLGRLHDDPPA